MAIEGLGRLYDVVPIASGVAINMDNCSGVTFVCTGNDTFSLTVATTFGGTYRAGSFFSPAWTPVSHYYQRADTNGTHAWTRQTQAAADNVVQSTSGYTTLIELLGTQLPSLQEPGGGGYVYVKCTAGGSGLVKAILHSLTVQRKPANLQIPSA